jgi:hypothetical protein
LGFTGIVYEERKHKGLGSIYKGDSTIIISAGSGSK